MQTLVSLGTALSGQLVPGLILAAGDEVSLPERSPWVFLCTRVRGLQGMGVPRLPGLAQVSSAGETVGEAVLVEAGACCLLVCSV